MNAVEFLRNEIENYQVAAKVYDDFGHVSCHFFKKEALLGDGHVELCLSSDGKIKILSQHTHIFYTTESTAEFIRILQVAQEIGSNWHREIEDEKAENLEADALEIAMKVYKAKDFSRLAAIQCFCKETGQGLSHAVMEAVDIAIGQYFPIYDQPQPLEDSLTNYDPETGTWEIKS